MRITIDVQDRDDVALLRFVLGKAVETYEDALAGRLPGTRRATRPARGKWTLQARRLRRIAAQLRVVETERRKS